MPQAPGHLFPPQKFFNTLGSPFPPQPPKFVLNKHGVADSFVTPVTSQAVVLTGVATGDLITVELGLNSNGATGITVSDNVNAGNYTAANTFHFDATNSLSTGIFYFVSSASGTITITASWTNSETAVIAAQSWSPTPGYTVSADATFNQQQDGSTSNPTTGSALTPAINGELVLAYLETSANTPTAGANFTLIDPDANFTTFPEYWIQVTATATNAPYTLATDTWTNQMVAFRLDAPSVSVTVTAAGNNIVSSVNSVSVTGDCNKTITTNSLTSSVNSVSETGDSNKTVTTNSLTSAVHSVSVSGSAVVTTTGTSTPVIANTAADREFSVTSINLSLTVAAVGDIIVVMALGTSGNPTVSGGGLVWTNDTAGSNHVVMATAIATSSGTLTVVVSAASGTIEAFALDVTHANGIDVRGLTTDIGFIGSGVSFNAPTLVPNFSGDLLLGLVVDASFNSVALTPTSPFAVFLQGSNTSIWSFSYLQPVAASITPSFTSSPGSVFSVASIAIKAGPSANTILSSVNSVAETAGSNKTVTGNTITSAVNSVSVSTGTDVAVTAAGNTIIATVNSVTVSTGSTNVTVTASGNTLSSSTNSVTVVVDVNKAITGNTISASVNPVAVTGNASKSVTGNNLVSSAGTVSFGALSLGNTITSSVGSVSVTGDANSTLESLRGNILTVSAGTVSVGIGKAFSVTGNTLTSSVHSVTVATLLNVNATGNTITSSTATPTVVGNAVVTVIGNTIISSTGGVLPVVGQDFNIRWFSV